MQDASESSFTADDLLAVARDRLKTNRSIGWLQKLVRDGLLASPASHGIPGRRGGRQTGTWSPAQFALFGELLEAMSNGAKRPELCNLVVERWIVNGPEQILPRQVLRALRTYRDAVHSRRATYKLGLELTTFLEAEPETMSRSMRKRFADAFMVAVHERKIDASGLNSKAFGETIVGTPLGQWLGPQGVVVILEVSKAGALAIDDSTDEQLEFVRQTVVKATARFGLMHVQLSKEPRLKHEFESPPDLLLSRNACSLVIAVLGIASKFGSQTDSSS